jgi:hypothetical protein
MPVIANTGAMLLIGHKGTNFRSALACRIWSETSIANAQPRTQFLAPETASHRAVGLLLTSGANVKSVRGPERQGLPVG